MGQKNSKGSVSLTNDNKRIRLRWTFQKVRYSLNLFQYKKENILRAKNIAIQIENDIAAGTFDNTLQKYNEQRSTPVVITLGKKKQLTELLEEWVRDYRNKDCDVHIDYYLLRQMMKGWGMFSESEVLKKFNSESISPKTYNGRLSLLKAFFSWTKKKGYTNTNPFEDVHSRKVSKRVKEERVPFTEKELIQILNAFKNDTYCPKSSRYKHSHYYPFVYFIFATGVRNAEAVGLRGGSVDLNNKLVTIKEVLARTIKGANAAARIRKETKNGKIRQIPLSDDLANILKSAIQGKHSDDLVFTSPTGLAIDDRMFQRRVFRKVLYGLNIPKRDLYACRHTFGSRCIDAGITPVMTAFLMGNNPETALRSYTHLINLPHILPQL